MTENQITTERIKSIFTDWELERDQLLALVSAIEQLLCPAPNEGPEFNAWKLAEIAQEMLGDARTINAHKERTRVTL
jgi:hypothetical protein